MISQITKGSYINIIERKLVNYQEQQNLEGAKLLRYDISRGLSPMNPIHSQLLNCDLWKTI